MSLPDDGNGRSGNVKTLGIRLEPELHAELTLVAQLREQTIADEIRDAIETHIQRIKREPQWASKADDVLAEIERQATARRDAFTRLFRTTEQASDPARTDAQTAITPSAARPRRRSSTADS